MERSYLIEWARRSRGMTQVELASRAGTSQATLSAYERGLKSPSLKVAQRLLEATGYDINLRVHIDWVQHLHPDVVPFWSPSILLGVETPACFARLTIRDSLRDGERRTFQLLNREDRKPYEILIQRHHPDETIRWIDGALLADAWDELDLPELIREAWKLAVFIAREPFDIDAEWYAMEQIVPGQTSQVWSRQTKRLRLPKPPPPRRSRFDPRRSPSSPSSCLSPS